MRSKTQYDMHSPRKVRRRKSLELVGFVLGVFRTSYWVPTNRNVDVSLIPNFSFSHAGSEVGDVDFDRGVHGGRSGRTSPLTGASCSKLQRLRSARSM